MARRASPARLSGLPSDALPLRMVVHGCATNRTPGQSQAALIRLASREPGAPFPYQGTRPNPLYARKLGHPPPPRHKESFRQPPITGYQAGQKEAMRGSDSKSPPQGKADLVHGGFTLTIGSAATPGIFARLFAMCIAPFATCSVPTPAILARSFAMCGAPTLPRLRMCGAETSRILAHLFGMCSAPTPPVHARPFRVSQIRQTVPLADFGAIRHVVETPTLPDFFRMGCPIKPVLLADFFGAHRAQNVFGIGPINRAPSLPDFFNVGRAPTPVFLSRLFRIGLPRRAPSLPNFVSIRQCPAAMLLSDFIGIGRAPASALLPDFISVGCVVAPPSLAFLFGISQPPLATPSFSPCAVGRAPTAVSFSVFVPVGCGPSATLLARLFWTARHSLLYHGIPAGARKS